MTERRHPGGLEILGPLGRGGTAEVVRVYDPQLRRECALKQPLKSAPVSEQLFRHLAEREFQLIGNLSYPGIVRCFRAELDSESPFLLIELCRGKTLYDFSCSGHLPFKLNVLCSIAVSLELIRARGLVHGDIKPHNIFLPVDSSVCGGDRLFYTKVTDFSMGKQSDEEETERAGRGTVGYMAPETIDGTATTHASDLFSFGVLAYWFLTGTHPFLGDDDDPLKINSRVQEDEPPLLHEVNTELPESLDAIVRPLLAKDASERTATAWEVAIALREAGATYPVHRALQPKHIVERFTDDGSVPDILETSERQARRLTFICSDGNRDLRLVLSANHARGNLTYASDGWHWNGRDVYWPARLRRRDLRAFVQASPTVRKQIVRGAVVGDLDWAVTLSVVDSSSLDTVPPATLSLVRPLLSQATVRRESQRLAPAAEKQELPLAAARLYLQAGELADAVSSVLRALEVAGADVVRVMGTVDLIIDLASMRNELIAVRELLLRKADYLKQSGQSNEALGCYEEIVALYAGRSADRFLASVYKALGDLHKARHDVDEGIAALTKAMEIYRQLDSDLDISHTYNNMGNIHWVASDVKSALRCYRKALRIQRRLGALREIASTLTNIGTIYAINGRFPRAINLFEQSMILKQKIENIQGSTDSTVQGINEISEVIANVNEIVGTIATAVEEQSATTQEIANNINQASTGIQEVNENVSQSSTVAEEITKDIAVVNQSAGNFVSSSDQMMGKAEELERMASDLNIIVSGFKV